MRPSEIEATATFRFGGVPARNTTLSSPSIAIGEEVSSCVSMNGTGSFPGASTMIRSRPPVRIANSSRPSPSGRTGPSSWVAGNGMRSMARDDGT
jgi:hypothetical protein